MKIAEKILLLGFVGIILLFGLCAFSLIGFAGLELWSALDPGAALSISKRFNSVLKCIAILTIAMASLELASTILEDNLKNDGLLSAPARTRRVLSRFLLVVVVSLSIECLVATFQYVNDQPEQLVQAVSIAIGAAALLLAWGVFLKLSRSSEL